MKTSPLVFSGADLFIFIGGGMSSPNLSFRALTKFGALVERADLTAAADLLALKSLKAFLKAVSSGLMLAQHSNISKH